MGEISDTIQRLYDEGTGIETIIAVVASMEALKPQRKAATATRGTRLASDWSLPPDWLQWAMDEFPGMPREYAVQQADTFRDYWCSKAGTAATKIDWQGTWRNWIRRAVEERRSRMGVGKPQSAVEQRRQALAERVANDHGIGRDRDRGAEAVRQLPLLSH